jgi:hypothetical protein
MAYWWVLAWVLVFSISISTLLLVLGYVALAPSPAMGLELLFGIVWGEVAAVVLVLAMVAYFKVYAGPDGLRAPTLWGNYRQVAWADVRRVRPFNFLGLRYLRVGTAGPGGTLWLPVFLSDLARFRAAVRRHAGPENPLAVALQDETF